MAGDYIPIIDLTEARAGVPAARRRVAAAIDAVHNLAEDDPLTDDLARWGHPVDGIDRRPHAVPELAYTIHWVDVPPESEQR